jgi:hypothetical protein
MADREDKVVDEKRKSENDKVTAAVAAIAQTEAGVIFFRWLRDQCHYNRSTISGDPTTYDVNTLGSIAQEFQRTIYLKLRRAFDRSAKIKIEID